MKANGILSRFFSKARPEENDPIEIIQCPLSGRVIPLEQVADRAFADKILGDGLAIIPREGRLYAPADGTTTNVPDTWHALSMTSDGGAELLIPVGRDTVALRGAHFHMLVMEGERVKKGQLLLEFDLPALLSLGYDMTVPVILTNGIRYTMKKLGGGEQAHGTPFLWLHKNQ